MARANIPPDWPLAQCSRQVRCRPHRWHVQELGAGETLLFLHGAGGSTMSFRDLLPELSKHFHVVAIDLPGQGFTQLGARHRSGLDETSADIAALIQSQDWQPTGIIGHSAGAAIALTLSQTLVSPRGQPPKAVGINAALGNFEGLAGVTFPIIAKLLAMAPFTANLFSKATGNTKRVSSLISGTGSKLDSNGLELYRQLVSNRDHVDGTLLMMAQWQLDNLLKALPQITAETLLIGCTNDKAVPAITSKTAADKMPNARYLELPDLGHLGHEEDPQQFVKLITDFMTQTA